MSRVHTVEPADAGHRQGREAPGGRDLLSEQVAVGVLLAAFVAHAYWLRGVAEDAFITFRYARHLASGLGFAWNPGEPPVEGFTSVLWVVVCAAFERLGLDVPLASQVAGTLAGILVLVAVHRLSRDVLALGRRASLVVVALCASAGPLAAWASSGMETTTFTLFVVLAVYQAARFAAVDARPDAARGPSAPGARPPRDARGTALTPVIACALLLFAATLARPEGFGVFALLGLAAIARWPARMGRRGLAGVATLAAVYLPLFAAYFAWRYAEFGYPLPNTFYAKTGGGLHQVARGATYAAYFGFHYVAPLLPWVALAAWERTRPGAAPRAAARRPVAEVLAVVLGYAAYVVAVGGDYMAMYRFWAPVLPLVYALAGLAVSRAIAASAGAPPSRVVLLAGLAALTCAAVLVHSTPIEARLFATAHGTHGTWRGVQVERWHVRRFEVIADELARHLRSDRDRVLTYDIGVVGYRLPGPIDDALGITDPVIAHQPARPEATGSSMAGHEKQDLAYSFSKAPALFMYTVRLRPEPADWPRLPAGLDAAVRRAYERRAVWVEDRANGERGYLTFLARIR